MYIAYVESFLYNNKTDLTKQSSDHKPTEACGLMIEWYDRPFV